MVRGMKVLKLLVLCVFSLSFLTGPYLDPTLNGIGDLLRSATQLLPF
jgi:hypothetical protein